MLNGVSSLMKEASLVKDYFPEPPTPTKRAWPAGEDTILAIQQTCLIASSKRTKFISTKFSL